MSLDLAAIFGAEPGTVPSATIPAAPPDAERKCGELLAADSLPANLPGSNGKTSDQVENRHSSSANTLKALGVSFMQSHRWQLDASVPDEATEVPTFEPWPIIEGREHFSIWVSDDPFAEWPEFIEGYHWDIRQPSRLQPLLAITRR